MGGRWVVVGCLGVLLAGCGGGSGSTGLITSEANVVDHVRETGSCAEFEGAPYCATDSPDATAPGGQSMSIVAPVPTAVATPTAAHAPTSTPTEEPEPTFTPGAGAPTPTATDGSEPSATLAPPTPARTTTPVRTKTPTPARTATPKPTGTGPVPSASPAGPLSVTAVVDGFEAGAACATAARAAGTEDRWQTAALVPLGSFGLPVTFPLPAAVKAPADAALLCFEDPPPSLPADLGTLTEADPTVVFVLPSS